MLFYSTKNLIFDHDFITHLIQNSFCDSMRHDIPQK